MPSQAEQAMHKNILHQVVPNMKTSSSSFHLTFISAFFQEWVYSFYSECQRCRVKWLSLSLFLRYTSTQNLELRILSQQPELEMRNTTLSTLPLASPLSWDIPNYICFKTFTSSQVCWFQKKYKNSFRKALLHKNVPITSSGDLIFSKYTQHESSCHVCVL